MLSKRFIGRASSLSEGRVPRVLFRYDGLSDTPLSRVPIDEIDEPANSFPAERIWDSWNSSLRKLVALAILFLLASSIASKANTNVVEKFLGPPSCSSSSCHGGAGDKSCQYTIWNKLDFHTRSYATLTTARSARFSDVLKLSDATTSPRCTTCHAPVQTIPALHRAETLKASDGVTCENCHGAAENWLRTHTRPDLSHADRVAAGMRDLKNLYVRANTCVACHQTVDLDLLNAGHPELTFELDGQAATEPRHWQETQDHAQIWIVGQLVALREMSWQLSKVHDEKLEARWSGLLWLMQRATAAIQSGSNLDNIPFAPNADAIKAAQTSSDTLARQIASTSWKPEMTKGIVQNLKSASADFAEAKVSSTVQARRAERLVLALDRLTPKRSSNAKIDSTLNTLFSEVQSVPNFDSVKFARTLQEFADADRQ